MGFWKTLLGGDAENPEEEKKNADAKQFDLLKYDGVKAMRMGQFDYAVKCYREALKLQEDLEVRDYLSQALIHLGALAEALAELKTLHELTPDNAEVLLQAAHVAYMQEDYEEMEHLCQQAQEIDGDNPRVHYLFSQACVQRNDVIGAIARLTKAIVLEPEFSDARLLRAQVLTKMGEVKGAQEDVDWLMSHHADHEDVVLAAARLAQAKGQSTEALSLYDKLIDMNPFQLDAYHERGRLRYETGDKKGAEEDMQKLLELNPNELADVSGDYSAEGVEQHMKRVYSAINPFGL
ncbi:MAG: tetratricopeptide repeat protein [Prevotella sp.]|nr:tetratricopeptide repeat protein [Prevotella sp.]